MLTRLVVRALAGAAIAAGLTPVAGSAQSPLRVVVLTEDPADERVEATREAVSHWSTLFADRGLRSPFGKVKVLRGPLPEQLVRGYAATVSNGGTPPATPNEFSAIPADIIVALSEGEIISFAIPLGNRGKRLIGVRSDSMEPLNIPNVARNVIAHELGHALGLGHNGDPSTLMCGRPASCRPHLYRSEEPLFFPLTDGEIGRLERMYSPR